MVKVNPNTGPLAGEGTVWFDYFVTTDIPSSLSSLQSSPTVGASSSPASASSSLPPSSLSPSSLPAGSLPSTTNVASSSSSKSSNVGAIVGGAVAGLLILALLIVFLVWMLFKRRTQASPTPLYHDPTTVEPLFWPIDGRDEQPPAGELH